MSNSFKSLVVISLITALISSVPGVAKDKNEGRGGHGGGHSDNNNNNHDRKDDDDRRRAEDARRENDKRENERKQREDSDNRRRAEDARREHERKQKDDDDNRKRAEDARRDNDRREKEKKERDDNDARKRVEDARREKEKNDKDNKDNKDKKDRKDEHDKNEKDRRDREEQAKREKEKRDNDNRKVVDPKVPNHPNRPSNPRRDDDSPRNAKLREELAKKLKDRLNNEENKKQEQRREQERRENAKREEESKKRRDQERSSREQREKQRMEEARRNHFRREHHENKESRERRHVKQDSHRNIVRVDFDLILNENRDRCEQRKRDTYIVTTVTRSVETWDFYHSRIVITRTEESVMYRTRWQNRYNRWHRYGFYGGYHYDVRPCRTIQENYYNPVVYWSYTNPERETNSTSETEYYYRTSYGSDYDYYEELRKPFLYAGLFLPTEEFKDLSIWVSNLNASRQSVYRKALTQFVGLVKVRMAAAGLGTQALKRNDIVINHYQTLPEDRGVVVEGFMNIANFQKPFKVLLDMEQADETMVFIPMASDDEPTESDLVELVKINDRIEDLNGEVEGEF